MSSYQKHNLCTVANKYYVFKCLVLYYSLIDTTDNFLLWILCIDEPTYSTFKKLNLPSVKLVKTKTFETNKLHKIKSERTKREYAWTLKSSFIYHLLSNKKQIKRLVYLDADIGFFSSAKEIFNIMRGKSIGITSHNFAKSLKHKAKQVGEFNSGVVFFGRDKEGLACSKDWMEKCIEFCHYKPHKLGVGDQMYLSQWPEKYKNLYVFKEKGVNLGPWTIIGAKKITKRGGNVYVDGEKLVCYHFHEFQPHSMNEFTRSLGYSLPRDCIEYIYTPYEKIFKKAMKQILSVNPNFKFGITEKKKGHRLKNKLLEITAPLYWKITSKIPFQYKVYKD